MRPTLVLALATLALSGCSDAAGRISAPPAGPVRSEAADTHGRRFLVVAAPGADLDALAASVAAAGASVVDRIPAVGMLVAESADPDFSAVVVDGAQAVLPDDEVRAWTEAGGGEHATPAIPSTVRTTASLEPLQWGLRAVEAQAAWSRGARGGGARVAILDAGIDHDHPELAPNLNLALSRSFVPGAPVFVPPVTVPAQLQHHGTQVAGVLTARADGVGTTGVAPEAEIVAVRVLGPAGFRFSDVIAGIVHAADVGADVVNMSFGTNFERHEWRDSTGVLVATAPQVQELVRALNRATRYAHERGVTLVAAAGNARIDRNHDADRMVLPADLAFVIAVSATSPIGFAFDASADPDVPASYTNHGTSRIDLSAPGGDFRVPGRDACTAGGVTFLCLVFDGVVTTENGGGYRWGNGTSFSAPHVAGVAAMLVGLNGGSMDPARVRTILRASADDAGKPGRDEHHGHGRVNARRAVEMAAP